MRRQRGWRQEDLAQAAGVPQSLISLIERGHAAQVRIHTLRRIFAALDAGFEGVVLWRGGGLDRLLDQRHAALVSAAVGRLTRLGWEVVVEATYSVYGERGSIDVLGAHRATRSVVVEEVKSELTSVEALGRKTDEKVRLVRRVVCRERFGWDPVAVGRMLILPDTDTARRAVHRHQAVLRTMFPSGGREMTRWLRQPGGDAAGIVFVADIARGAGTGRRPAPERVRRPLASAPRA